MFFDESKAENVKVSGITTADSVNIIIPFDVEVEQNRQYKEPKQYQQFPQNAWTIQESDIIVKGLVDRDIMTQSELEKAFDNVYLVNVIDTKQFGSLHFHHWEVGAT